MSTRRTALGALGVLLAAAILRSAAHADTLPAAGAAAPPPSAAPTEPALPSSPAPEPALPAGHIPALQMAVDPRNGVRIGELVHVKLSAEATLGDDVTVVDQSFAPFEVQKKQARVEAPSAGKQRFHFDLDLIALEPGNAAIPEIELRVVTKDGFVGNVKTSPVPMTVRSWLGNEPNAQPKRETKPVTVMQDNYVPLYVLAAILAAALIAAATLFIQRYLRKRRERALPPPPPRPPWEIAIEKLAELRRQKQRMLEDCKGGLFVDQLSDVLREYLGGRFGFDGLETTTDEMLTLLKHRAAGLGFTQEVGQFLNRCDLVKFAKVTPDQDEVDLLFAKATDLVQHSQPQQQAPAQPQAAAGGATP